MIKLNFLDGLAVGLSLMLWLDGALQMAVYVFTSLVLAGIIFEKAMERDDEND